MSVLLRKQDNASHDVIDLPLEDFDLAKVHDRVIMITRIINPEDIDANFEILEETQLPEGVVPLSPILRLTPEAYKFPHPVRLLLPTCHGATKAWRSTSSGWEELKVPKDASFFQGYALLYLTHFCEVFAGREGKTERYTDALAFWKQGDSQSRIQAKWAIRHVGCDNCTEKLQLYMNDSKYLKGFSECPGVFDLGKRTHGSELTIVSNTMPCRRETSPTRRDKCELNFARFPVVEPDEESPAFLPENCYTLSMEVSGGKHDIPNPFLIISCELSGRIHLDLTSQVIFSKTCRLVRVSCSLLCKERPDGCARRVSRMILQVC